MVIDSHAHVTAPDSLYVYKAGLLAHRGGHGRGAVTATDEDLTKALNAPVFGGIIAPATVERGRDRYADHLAPSLSDDDQ